MSEVFKEMANLRSAVTGLPFSVYISSEEGGHGPRIKVYQGRPSAESPSSVFQINTDTKKIPEFLDGVEITEGKHLWSIRSWIDLNRTKLLKMWYKGNSMYADEWNKMVSSLTKVTPAITRAYKHKMYKITEFP